MRRVPHRGCYCGRMRTTVNLTPDIEAEVARLRREEGLGTSEAVVLLARRGLRSASPASTFVQRTTALHARVDLSNVGDVLDQLDDR
jgi:hypothetical protein